MKRIPQPGNFLAVAAATVEGAVGRRDNGTGAAAGRDCKFLGPKNCHKSLYKNSYKNF